MSLTLRVLPGELAVSQLPAGSPIPDWATNGSFWNLASTPEELSVICAAAQVPVEVKSESGWALLVLQGPFAFELTGILTQVLEPLRDAGIGIFACSTYNTDYVLLKAVQLDQAVTVLRQAGHIIEGLPG